MENEGEDLSIRTLIQAVTKELRESQADRLAITARYFSAGPSDSTSRWTPCPPKYNKRWLQVGLGCIQLSPSCPVRPLHTFHFLRPARLRTPLLGYGAPHLSARGTSTLLNNALLSAHFRIADNPDTAPPLPLEFGTPELVTSYGTHVTQAL